jgi:cyanate permease
MMRSVWATLLSVWLLFAVIAVLAWTRQQPAPSQSPVIVVKGKNGTPMLVPATTAATHATTRTSPVPAG